MEGAISSEAAGGSHIKSLSDLPNEILLQIFSYVDLQRGARIMGYIPDDPPPSPPDSYLIDDFRVNQDSLRSIALTCKRFTPLLQEALLYAPVLDTNQTRPNALTFLLKLCGKPELARHVKQLRIHLPQQNPAYSSQDILEESLRIVASSILPQSWKETWSTRIQRDGGRTCIEALLMILPQLRHLCISDPNSVLRLDQAEGSVLSFLKVESPLPPCLVGLANLPHLQTLDLSLRIRGEPSNVVGARTMEHFSLRVLHEPHLFHNIHHLRLDFEVRTVGVWNATSRDCMANVVQAFKSLKTLEYYAESSESKNPYRSVRAFPAYQANIQNYPDVFLPLAAEVADEPYWDRTIYDARTEITDYQNLVDGLVHVRPTLERLQLPGGFWTLPGAVRKQIPRFDQFTRMKTLVVPQAVIISIKLDKMRFDVVSGGDFELSPSLALPRSLQHLKIFDVDAAFLESLWLQELFREQNEHCLWPALRCFEILLGPTYSGIELEELLARRSGDSFWKLVGDANLEVVVGRDMEGPEFVAEYH